MNKEEKELNTFTQKILDALIWAYAHDINSHAVAFMLLSTVSEEALTCFQDDEELALSEIKEVLDKAFNTVKKIRAKWFEEHEDE